MKTEIPRAGIIRVRDSRTPVTESCGMPLDTPHERTPHRMIGGIAMIDELFWTLVVLFLVWELYTRVKRKLDSKYILEGQNENYSRHLAIENRLAASRSRPPAGGRSCGLCGERTGTSTYTNPMTGTQAILQFCHSEFCQWLYLPEIEESATQRRHMKKTDFKNPVQKSAKVKKQSSKGKKKGTEVKKHGEEDGR